MQITIRNEISGKSEVVKYPLLAKDICVGRVFWYRGFASQHSWDCPGIITRVDRKEKRFWIRSLDDMEVQIGWYEFSITKDSPDSRKTMRVVPAGDVKKYLDQRQKQLSEEIASAESALKNADSRLASFKKQRKLLEL